MKKFIPFLIMLLPGIAYAGSNCQLVEFSDHFEAVCTGDGKASTPPANAATAIFSAPPAQTSEAAAAEPAAAPQRASGPVGRRQRYQQGMEEARAARLQLINERQQGVASR